MLEFIDMNAQYIEKNKKKFLQLFENPSLIFNKNISSEFYSKKEFQQVIQNDNNILETEWKTRILFESTPRGNVIMYYNPYKLGFSYYADQYIPYDILNSVAMKYVTIYRCLDFFIDELILPENKKNPLMVLFQEDKKEVSKEDNNSLDDEFKNKLKSAPFAKLKSYKLTGKKDEKKDEKDNKKVVEQQKERNRFINMGKTSNYNFLKVPEKKKISLFSSSELVSDLIDNISVQKEVFSYRNFKKTLLEKGKNNIVSTNMYAI
jgi:hypothetical protein